MPYKVTTETVTTMNILVYGPQGVGKTVFAATSQDHPDLADVLFVNIEGGLISVANRGDIDAEDINSTEELESLFWKLANKDPEYAHYKTIVIDSVTELQTINLEEIVNAAMGGTGGRKGKRTNRDEVWQEDYGKSTVQLKRLLRWFKELPLNVILTALPKKIFPKGKQDENVEPIEVAPSITNKLGDSLMGYVDFVWYMFEEQGEDGPQRFLLTRNKGVFRAKTRGVKFAEAMGEIVENPNMAKLYNLYLESEGEQ